MSEAVLYDYHRSSACYRVRIGLNLLGIAHRTEPLDLRAGDHHSAAHRMRNPQGLVPVLEIDGLVLTQSLAILEYLHETRADSTLLPGDAPGRARVRMLAHAIAMEIHPVCNSSVAAHVAELTGREEAKKAWMHRFIGKGLDAFEMMLQDEGTGRFCHGDAPTLADCCLIPQLYNAERWGLNMAGWKHIAEVAGNIRELDAVAAAHPDRARAEA